MELSAVLPTDRMSKPGALRRIIELAEAVGFNTLWLPDHIVIPSRVISSYPYSKSGKLPVDDQGYFLECVATIAYASAVSSRLRFGTEVLVLPMRNTLLVAKQLATIHELSGGRVRLGVGAGWMQEEFEVLGESFEDRGKRLDQSIDLLRRVWADATWPQRVAAEEEEGFAFSPQPGEQRIPIYVGGNGPRSRQRAVDSGDGWIPAGLPRKQLVEGIHDLHERAIAAGREPADVAVIASAMTSPSSNSRAALDERRTVQGKGQELTEEIGWYAEQGVRELIVFPSTDRSDTDLSEYEVQLIMVSECWAGR